MRGYDCESKTQRTAPKIRSTEYKEKNQERGSKVIVQKKRKGNEIRN